MKLRLGVLVSVACFACSSSSDEPHPPAPGMDGGGPEVAAPDATDNEAGGPETGSGDAPASTDGPIGGDRPVDVHVPPGYMPGVPAPLVLLLHGYSASGDLQEFYFGLTALSDERGFLYAHPDGTMDATGNRFWNATDACCSNANTTVDDSAYLSGLITQIGARYSVDPKRVFLVGHSNGGFMSYRMACDHADQIAAIASLAGAMFADVTECHASEPVSILQIHGTADTTIAYMGGMLQGHAYPGAPTTVLDWALLDGCSPTSDMTAPPLDLETTIVGDETKIAKYGAGCRPGGHAELWTIEGGSHIPALGPSFSRGVVDFLFAHPKR